MSIASESVRWTLLEAVERCYYVGPVAGQRWLATLSALVQTLPRDDDRLVRLARTEHAPDLGAFIAHRPPTQDERLAPSSWLDGYVDWALAVTPASA